MSISSPKLPKHGYLHPDDAWLWLPWPALDVHPFMLMASVCVASSCAFMLPFATAPNVNCVWFRTDQQE
ncbi:MAG: hypothetical protein R3B93_19620 [Bacteroidia bacterium]